MTGIDIDACQNVSITDSLIASQDDCIAVKSGRNEEGRRVGIPSEQVTIENCSLVNHSTEYGDTKYNTLC